MRGMSEKCEKCGRTEDVGVWVLAGVESPFCEWCVMDTEGLEEWLADAMRRAVESSPDYFKTSDGQWRRA